jgi:TetR/AcrR family transcriptional repressor of nem operon
MFAMTTKQEQKKQTRKKIIGAASGLFREEGYKPTRIDNIMESIGLTVGGFYNHFDSKDALFREVVDNTVSFVVEGDDPGGAEPVHSLEQILNMYLSEEHRDAPANGCIAPCLSAEIARADDDVRAAYSAFVNRVVDKIAVSVDSGGGLTKRQRAIAIVSMLVGALSLARAVGDEQTSKQILKASRKAAGQI